MNLQLQPAQEQDLPAVATLMNAAFRGTGAQQGWCVEAGYITGDRTSVPMLGEEMAAGAQILLVKDQATAALQGCVSLQAISPVRWYLGSLAVDPARQNDGLGRDLLAAAEQYAANHGARMVEITVVNVRETLISWYERRGYQLTGETRPFPYGDSRVGRPTREDLAFVVLERHLFQ